MPKKCTLSSFLFFCFVFSKLRSTAERVVCFFVSGASGLAYQFFVKTDDTEAQEVALTQADESSTVDGALKADALERLCVSHSLCSSCARVLHVSFAWGYVHMSVSGALVGWIFATGKTSLEV